MSRTAELVLALLVQRAGGKVTFTKAELVAVSYSELHAECDVLSGAVTVEVIK